MVAGMSIVLAMLVTTAVSVYALPPATNDNFANAKVISSSSLPYVEDLDATGSTAEGGETAGSCTDPIAQSVWWRITPTFSGYLRADNSYSVGPTDLTIYRGTTLGNLVEVGCSYQASDDESNGRTAFRVVAGQRYYIRTSTNGGLGYMVLHLRKVKPPKNDNFASATQVTSLPFNQTTSTLNATFEPNEPETFDIGRGGCELGRSTIWYTIRPTSTTVIRADVVTGFDTEISVYRGTSLGNLNPLLCNDDISGVGSGYQSNVAFTALAGKRYYIRVSGYLGENGDVTVRIRKGTPPANDRFANAETLLANGALHHVTSTAGATAEPNEPQPSMGACSTLNSWATVWYAFNAPTTDAFAIDASTSGYYTLLAVYTGPSLSNLTEVACADSTYLEFPTTSGTQYWIQVGGRDGDSGEVQLHLNAVP
jgi:hypothetical protein